MIWCNKEKYNFLNKLLKSSSNKEIRYLRNLIETEDLEDNIVSLVNEFFIIHNNFDLYEFVKKQSFFEFEFTDDMFKNNVFENKEKVAYAIVEAILKLVR